LRARPSPGRSRESAAVWATDSYARTHWGSATSATCWKTTRTGSPMVIVAGSISLMAPSGVASRFPTIRMVGSSSIATTITVYGASAAYAGSSGGWGTTNDQIVPRPDTGTHVAESDRQCGHI